MIRITGQIRSTDNVQLDGNYGPYETTHEAHEYLSGLMPALNKVGVTVGIKDNTTLTIEEYWYQGGTTEAHLVKKLVKADSELSSTSENPVQNKVVKAALDNKGTYSKPDSGIPSTDLASDVQTSLGKANSALQSETDPTVPSWAKQQNKPTYTASEVNAIPMPTGGSDEQILAKDSNETAGVKWVPKPSDGKSAYQIWYEENGYSDPTTYNEEYFLASLKAQFGSFVPADYGTDGKPASGGTDITASASTTNYIYLVDNLSSNPTAKVMWITVVDETDPSNPTYSWQNIGEAQVSLLFKSSQSLDDVNIVNDLTTGGVNDVLSAEQGKVLGDEVFGEYDFVDISLIVTDESYYVYVPSQNKINVTASNVTTISSIRIPVVSGDKFKVFGKDKPDASAVRLWCFSDGTDVDGKYSVLSVADNDTDTREDGVVITAPEGSVYLSIAFYQYDSTQDKIQKWGKTSSGLIDKTKFESGQDISETSIIDNLTNDSANDVLSAKQGKLLGDTLFDSYSWQLDMDDLSLQHYYNTHHNYIDSALSYSYASCIRLTCVEGDKFKIFGKGNSEAVQLYAFTNLNTAVLDKPNASIDSRVDGIELTAPQNASYLYINFYQYDSSTDKVLRYTKNSEGLVTKVSRIENQGSKLKGKNIVVFGDSLSEFKYQNKGWCDWASEMSEANFINVAIGGTQINQRAAYSNPNKTVLNGAITLFDESVSYNIGDWVYYKPSTTMNVYICSTAHTGVWNDDDFTELASGEYYYAYSPLDIINIIAAVCSDASSVDKKFRNQIAAAECVKNHNGDNNDSIISRLIDIDWSTVDAVVVMGGANDFNDKRYGTTGSTNINTTLGALNEIVRMLNSTFSNIPIYWVTDTVRWFNYSSGTGSDADWCDVYVSPNGGTLTYKEFFKAIVDEAVINHLPVIDLYNELGWNKWNFSNFFTDNDGTHPYKGFRQIAEKIVSGIIANKVF